MYSYEQRIKAVELYIKFDKNASAVVRELGYPTTRMLTYWYQEYLEEGDLHKKSRLKSGYTAEQRDVAIKHYLEYGKSLTRTVRALGYPCRQLLGKWVYEALPFDCHPLKRGSSGIEYTDKQKKSAVVSVSSGEKTVTQIHAEMGVARKTIYKWKRQLLGEDDNPEMRKKQKREPENPSAEQDSDLRAECDELKEERDTLLKQVQKLQLERDILEKAAEILKKDKGIGIDTLSNREKALIIDALTCKYPVGQLMHSLQMAKSSYFYQRHVLKRDKYKLVRQELREAFAENRKCYGYRRLHAVLTFKGLTISQKVILRLMHEENLVVPSMKRKKYSSYKGELSPEVENLLNRDFYAENPNEKWLSDITEFRIPAGKVYLSPIVDCFDGYVTSWTRGRSPNAEMVNVMLDDAVESLKAGENPLVHTDRGCHYRWPGWIERMDSAGLIRSMSKKGCSPDNSAMEGFFGRLKNEMFYSRSWFGVSIEEFCSLIDNYIFWYNDKRIKMSLGGKSPLEYRRSLGLA